MKVLIQTSPRLHGYVNILKRRGDSMVEILTMATVIAPFTSGIVQVVKQATNMKKRFLPLTAVGIGIALGAAAYFVDVELGARMWAGGISGLAATGLFELGKNTVDQGEDETI